MWNKVNKTSNVLVTMVTMGFLAFLLPSQASAGVYELASANPDEVNCSDGVSTLVVKLPRPSSSRQNAPAVCNAMDVVGYDVSLAGSSVIGQSSYNCRREIHYRARQKYGNNTTFYFWIQGANTATGNFVRLVKGGTNSAPTYTLRYFTGGTTALRPVMCHGITSDPGC